MRYLVAKKTNCWLLAKGQKNGGKHVNNKFEKKNVYLF